MQMPFQRPSKVCRTFESAAVEGVIEDITSRMKDPDLARLFENAFPNTLDTTVRWHVDDTTAARQQLPEVGGHTNIWGGPQTFVVTGDINAEWLRDSTNQLAQYQVLGKKDPAIQKLLLGAIATQANYVMQFPYCNAFQPPPPSRLHTTPNGQSDTVHPAYEQTVVFECKYELDSLAHFLALGNQYFTHTSDHSFVTELYLRAVRTVLQVLREQSKPTFDPQTGRYLGNEYTFRRRTDVGTETLSLWGLGNPLNSGTGLVRSAFRPSDDATILGFFIPANAMMAVELKRAAKVLEAVGKAEFAAELKERGDALEKAVWEHGVVHHRTFGDVFAFEVDGYGSSILMDDANSPSLLALPLLGFCDKDNKVYRNTRKMILSRQGNPYYLEGEEFHGIGGPHIDLRHAWPLSLLVQAQTSDDDEEISKCLRAVRNVSVRGLINESVDVNNARDYTRSWFAWANSVFAQTIIDLAARKPYLLFGEGAEAYVIE